MKKTHRFLAAAFALAMLFSFTACGDKDNDTDKPAPTPDVHEPWQEEVHSASSTFGLHYKGSEVAAGSLITYVGTDDDIANEMIAVSLVIENKTESDVVTMQKVELVEGPNSMKEVSICGNGSCPWDGNAYTTVPGLNAAIPVAIEVHTPDHTRPVDAVYRVTVGQGRSLADPQVVFLRIKF